MAFKVKYEWDAETIDEHGDVHDHHYDTLENCLALTPGEGLKKFIVLVRDVFSSFDDNLEKRSWAYVDMETMKLPEMFDDGDNRVPKRFHEELEKAVAKIKGRVA
jgi:hypothetical protein